MKWSCYDLFDHYDAESYGMPSLKTDSIHTKAVMERVHAQTGTQSQHVHRSFHFTKLTAAVAAAAVLLTGGTMVTAAAGYGGLDTFFHSLFADQVPETPEKMENLVTIPGANFDSTNENVQFGLLGMYGDGSQVMLSFKVTAADGVELSEDLASVVEMSITGADGVSKPLVYSGNWYSLKASETEENVFYMNLFLRDSDLKGKTLDLTFQNFYTSHEIQTVYNKLQEFQEEVRNEYIKNTLGEDALEGLDEGELPAEFDLEAWKTYWNAQNGDQLLIEKENELYAASDRAIDGLWHTSIVLDFAGDESITAEYAYGEIKLQTLSAQISCPTEMDSEDQSVQFVLTLKDGRKVSTDPWMVEDPTMDLDCEALPDGYMETTELYADWNADKTVQTNVICYSEPIAPQDIAEIRMVQFAFDWDGTVEQTTNGGYYITNDEVIYTAQ